MKISHTFSATVGAIAVCASPCSARVRQREQRIPGVDRVGASPDHPDGRATMPRGAVVLNVVVDQRKVMQQFDGGGGGQRSLPVSAGGFGRRAAAAADGFACRSCRSIGLIMLVHPAERVAQHGAEILGIWKAARQSTT